MTQKQALQRAKNYVEEADIFHHHAKFREELTPLNNALNLYQEWEKWQEYADTLNRLARCYIVIEDISIVESYLKQAIRICEAYLPSNSPTLATAYHHHGYLSEYKGNHQEAMEYLHKATDIWLQFPDDFHVEKSATYNRATMIAIEMTDLPMSINMSQKSQEILTNFGLEDHPEMAINIELRAEIAGYTQRENTVVVLEMYKQALAIKENYYPPSHPTIAMALYGIGTCCNEIHDLEIAKKNFYDALSIIEKTTGKKSIFYNSTLTGLATAYFNERNLEHALKLFRQVLKGYQLLPTSYPNLMANVHYHIAICLTNLNVNEYQEVMNEYETAISFFENPKHFYLSYIYNGMGVWEQNHQNYSKALSCFQRAIDIGEPQLGPYSPIIIRNYTSVADVLLKTQRYDGALKEYQQVFSRIILDFNDSDIYTNPNTKNNSYAYLLLKLLTGKGAAFYERYLHQSKDIRDLNMAFDTYKIAHELIDSWHKGYQGTTLRYKLAEESQEIYESLLNIIHTLSKDEQADKEYLDDLQRFAFECSEKNHNIFLLSSLKREDSQIAASISEDLLKREKDLRYEMVLVEKKIEQERQKGSGEDPSTLLSLQKEIYDKNKAYQNLIKEFEQKYPDYFQLKYDTSTVSIENVQSILGEDTLMIEYFVGEESLYAFVISKTKFQIVPLVQGNADAIQEIQATTEDYFEAFNGPKTHQKWYIEAAHELYLSLLSPIMEEPKGIFDAKIHKKIVFIPDDFLNSIPFEALLSKKIGPSLTSMYQDLPYLLHQFTISYHYSATLHYYLQKKESNDLADTFIGFAPVYDFDLDKKNAPDSPKRNIQTESVYIRGKGYEALLDSEKEIKEIGRIFQQERNREPEIYLRQEATLEKLLDKLKKPFKYIHLSAHGYRNEEIPELSGIVLSPTSEEKTADSRLGDGSSSFRGARSEEATKHTLTIPNVYNLDLKSTELVVASCCESGQGKFVQGEGMIALNRGFLYAGAKNVVYTLENVDDKASCNLNIAFYNNFLKTKGNMSYALALQKAKQSIIQQSHGEFDAAPMYWASFVLIETPTSTVCLEGA